MPTYQYACTACDERLEVVQRFSDDPLTECSVCGGRLRKVFSPVGIVFKGSGFYRTDSRSNSNGAGKPKDAPAKDAQAKDTPASSSSSETTNAASGDSGSSSSSDTKTSKKAEPAGSGKSSTTPAKVA